MASSWLDELVEARKEAESPERYWYWAGLAIIAALVRKNVYLNRHIYKLYPNIYVALVSERSGLRKGVPIALAKKILENIQVTRVISGRNSIQGVIKEFSTQRTLPNGVVLSDAQGLLLSDEFESFLVSDEKSLTIMTALFNTHEHESGWKNTLKNSPVEELKNPCISLLAASNETLFESMVKGKDVEGGFLARTFVVYESKRRLINPLVYVRDGRVVNPEAITPAADLADHIRRVTALNGEIKWSLAAATDYISWYNALAKMSVADRTGTFERLGDQVLKVAMLISLARDNDLEIRGIDLEEAISRCEECVAGLRHVTIGGAGQGELSDATKRVIKVLIRAPENKLARSKLLKKLWPDLDAVSLDRVIDTLMQANVILQPKKEGKEIVYKLSEEAHEAFVKFTEE